MYGDSLKLETKDDMNVTFLKSHRSQTDYIGEKPEHEESDGSKTDIHNLVDDPIPDNIDLDSPQKSEAADSENNPLNRHISAIADWNGDSPKKHKKDFKIKSWDKLDPEFDIEDFVDPNEFGIDNYRF